jgi:ribosomal protein S14
MINLRVGVGGSAERLPRLSIGRQGKQPRAASQGNCVIRKTPASRIAFRQAAISGTIILDLPRCGRDRQHRFAGIAYIIAG